MSRAIRLGVVSGEFFDGQGPYGGFGWLARQIGRLSRTRPELGIDVINFVARGRSDRARGHVNGESAVFPHGRRVAMALRVPAAHVDLLLSVDYRPGYNFALKSASRAPMVLWMQDPRAPDDLARAATLRLPGDDVTVPEGGEGSGWGQDQFRYLLEWRRRFGVGSGFAVSAPSVLAKCEGAYGVAPRDPVLLPYPVAVPGSAEPPRDGRGREPRVAFVGRLDPVKRPWIAMELARRLPHVTFVVLGRSNRTGPGSWQPGEIPGNVHLLGHIDGASKYEAIRSCHLLLNTSIHEALPVTWVEALMLGLPVVASVDTESVASRFGRYVGEWKGDGLDSLDAFEAALTELFADRATLRERAIAGQRWATEVHGHQAFMRGLDLVLDRSGVRRPRRWRALQRHRTGLLGGGPAASG